MNEPLHSSPRIAAILGCTGAELRGLCNFTNPAWKIQPGHGAGTRSALWTDLEALRLFILWQLGPELGPELRRRAFTLITDEDLIAAKDGRHRYLKLLDTGEMDDDGWSAKAINLGTRHLVIDEKGKLDLNDLLDIRALNLTRLVRTRLHELHTADYEEAPEGD